MQPLYLVELSFINNLITIKLNCDCRYYPKIKNIQPSCNCLFKNSYQILIHSHPNLHGQTIRNKIPIERMMRMAPISFEDRFNL